MKTVKFTMSNINDIKQLVELAHMAEGDVLIKKNSYCVDATSILGVLSIDITHGAEIIYPENAFDLDQFISNFC